jgi:hypothetical protein
MGIFSLTHRRSFARRRVGVGAGAASIVALLLLVAVFFARSSTAVEDHNSNLEEELHYIGKYKSGRHRARSVRGRYTPGSSRRSRFRGNRARRGLLDDAAAEALPLPSGKSEKKVVTDAPRAAMTNPKMNTSCVTPLDILETHPNLTRLRDAISDLPDVRAALADRSATHTFFAPTDEACFRFTQWWGVPVQSWIQLTHGLKAPGFKPCAYKVQNWFQSLLSTCAFTQRAGYNDTKEGLRAGLIELLGDKDDMMWRGDLIAYHILPGRSLTTAALAKLQVGLYKLN